VGAAAVFGAALGALAVAASPVVFEAAGAFGAAGAPGTLAGTGVLTAAVDFAAGSAGFAPGAVGEAGLAVLSAVFGAVGLAELEGVAAPVVEGPCGTPKLGIFFSLGSSLPRLAKYASRACLSVSVPK
jgi:hypothetical protein